MENKSLTIIQIIIAVVALLYIVSPDLLLGPFDDAAIAGIATLADVILGVVKHRIPKTNGNEEVIKDIGGDEGFYR